MTTPMPTSGHCVCGHSKDHLRKAHPASVHPGSGHSPSDHKASAHRAVTTLARRVRVTTEWAFTGGLIAAAAFAAGWVERGHSDGR